MTAAARTGLVDDVWRVLDGVPDPEVPALSILDLGIVRAVRVSPDGHTVHVDITPTYSGCPALRAIEEDIAAELGRHFARVEVRTVLSPAWTTEWLSERGRARLAGFGIAPPHRADLPAGRPLLPVSVTGRAAPAGRPDRCPQCGSRDVELVSEFGSTACKALYRCGSCAEPFDYFKAH